MCGIAGILNFGSKQKISYQLLDAMISKIAHRGPDGLTSKIFSKTAVDNIGLAHARLSIIDLKTGTQPIANEDKSIWVVFNGEIFNYIELRKSLIAKGHQFSTQTDTEVIVHLYEQYGNRFVNHLNGQFAIALYDQNKGKTLLIRDRVGIAPLFYTQLDSMFYFASEIKSLLVAFKQAPSLHLESLDQLFTFWSPISPNTLFKGVFEVSPGQMLIIENNKIVKESYWDWSFPQQENYASGSSEQLSNQLKDHLIEATQIRLRSDVAVGAYLSGGLDSSTIVALINNYTDTPLRTFSIGFNEQDFDESAFQNILTRQLETEHSFIQCANADIAENFLETIWHTESPILRTAPVPMKILSSLVKKNQYKVVLTGEGADEVLGGYDIFKEAKIRKFWSKYPDSTLRPALLRKLYPYLNMSAGDAYLKAFFGQGIDDPDHFSFSHLTRWSSTAKCKDFFSKQTQESIKNNALESMQNSLPKHFKDWHFFNRAQYIESKSLMGGYLLCSQGDRMLMSNSVEGRFPFLDHHLIEFANALHPKFKMKALNEKYLLKKAMSSELDQSIVKRHKQPYRAPNIPAFFSGKSQDYVIALLSEDKINQYGYFDSKRVSRLIKKIEKGRAIGNTDNMALVGILSTQVWHYHFIENFTSNFNF